MKHLILITFCFLLSAALYAQESNLNVRLLSSTIDKTVIQYELNDVNITKVNTNQGVFDKITIDGTTPVLEAGAPEIVKNAVSIVIPDDGVMSVSISGTDFVEYDNIDLIPSKGNLKRDIDPASVPYTMGPLYQQNKFFPSEIAELRDPYILRDYRGQTVLFYPVQYNPATKKLRVYKSATITINKSENGGINTFENSREKPIVSEFNEIYKRHFLNYAYLGINYTPVGEDGNMLIISHGNFLTAMQPFMEWKIQQGIPCEIVNVATIGTTATAIQTFVTNYYNTNGLTYLLLVGDASFVPTKTLTSGHSDNGYAYITGSDHYPEFFVGRFSAETAAHAQTMVDRTLEYEKFLDTDDGWITNHMGIASDQGPGDDNEMDYEHIRNMQTDLSGFTYGHNYEYFDGTQGGNDAAGSPTASSVASQINSGAGIILYTGHGSTTTFVSSGFSNTNVNSLTNTGKLPFIWSVACVNGNFVNSTCFAEAWTRATHNNAPAGALATLMSTINQSWNPPMEGQDEMVDILVESYANNIKRSFGGLSMNGCMKMNDTYGSGGDEMTDTWTLFGDPSVMVRTDTPEVLTATHQAIVFVGTGQLQINSPVDGAKFTLSYNNSILGTELISGGSATINFTPLTTPDTITLVGVAFNHTPYIIEIPVIVSNAPFLVYDAHIVDDSQHNNNLTPDFGETVGLDLTIENIGVFDANNVNVVLQSLNPYITVFDSTANYGTIQDSSSVLVNSAFTISISDSVPDQYFGMMRLVMTDSNNDTWQSNFKIQCHAPNLVIDSIYIKDHNTGGNGNNKLEPGEVAELVVEFKNNGHCNSTPNQLILTNNNSNIYLINSNTINIDTLKVNTGVVASYVVKMDTAFPIGNSFEFDLLLESGYYDAETKFKDVIYEGHEDWETGTTTKFPWALSGDANWVPTTGLPYQGSYCLRSGNISHSESSVLTIDWFASFPDTISFYLKTSCENGSQYQQKWDYLEFFIDGASQDWWDGNKAWMKVEFPVSAGQHTFKWVYEKDAYASTGSDCAWIDLITFPAAGNTVELNPYIHLDQTIYSDATGNNDGIVNPGEDIEFSHTFKNVGYKNTTGVDAALTTTDPYISIVTGNASLGNMNIGSVVNSNNIFKVKVDASAPVMHTANLDLTLTDDSANTWVYTIPLTVGIYNSIEEGNIDPEINMWPNPATTFFNLSLESATNTKAVIKVYSIDGKVVELKEWYIHSGTNSASFGTTDMESGVYIISIEIDGRRYQKKLIKK